LTTEYLNNKIFEETIAIFQQSKRERVKYKLIIEDDLETARKRLSIRKNQIAKKELNARIRKKRAEYKATIINYDESQNKLAHAFYILSENLANYANFQYIDTDDAVQEGVLICFEKIDRFDPAKGKAFNYMTTCILNHFRQLYRSARHYNDLKKKYSDFIQQQLNNVLLGRSTRTWAPGRKPNRYRD